MQFKTMQGMRSEVVWRIPRLVKLGNDEVAMFRGNRREDKFVSKNVINLSRSNLPSAEIALLSKRLKFVPTANKIGQAKLKRELEEYGKNSGSCGSLEMMNGRFPW